MNIASLKKIVDETPPEDIRSLELSNYFPKHPEKYTVKEVSKLCFYMLVYKHLVKRKVRKIRKEIRKA